MTKAWKELKSGLIVPPEKRLLGKNDYKRNSIGFIVASNGEVEDVRESPQKEEGA